MISSYGPGVLFSLFGAFIIWSCVTADMYKFSQIASHGASAQSDESLEVNNGENAPPIVDPHLDEPPQPIFQYEVIPGVGRSPSDAAGAVAEAAEAAARAVEQAAEEAQEIVENDADPSESSQSE